jgi:NadR type nicotinamide-nucleotide adenylyltransferase
MKNKILYNRGLVIGKFYPPHKGHEYLIKYATNNCKDLIVVVCDSPLYKIPAASRVEMLKKIFPRVKVISVIDIGKDDDSVAWAEYTRNFLGYAPEVVFTSEHYGDNYAKYLGAKHIKLDIDRIEYPISGTAVRSNVYGNIEWINPKIRSYLIPKVVIVGAESTGTTTLANALAKHYKANNVLEYGRFYSEIKSYSGIKWESEDFEHIAKIQNQIEKRLHAKSSKVLICDTNSFATEIWHERYMGYMSRSVKRISDSISAPDLYILTGDEIPFVQDGTRDGEGIRHQMHQRFLEELESRGHNYILVTGSKEKRFSVSVKVIDSIIESHSKIV